MCEFASLDRCAAYVAARAALIAVQRAAADWPDGLGARARHGAIATVQLTAEAVSHDHATAGRRQCLRDAITTALGVAATIDVAHAMGYGGGELLDVQRVAGRAVALLGMLLHASTALPAS
jgi:hypothetical protein